MATLRLMLRRREQLRLRALRAERASGVVLSIHEVPCAELLLRRARVSLRLDVRDVRNKLEAHRLGGRGRRRGLHLAARLREERARVCERVALLRALRRELLGLDGSRIERGDGRRELRAVRGAPRLQLVDRCLQAWCIACTRAAPVSAESMRLQSSLLATSPRALCACTRHCRI
jgi:hypothetical protein